MAHMIMGQRHLRLRHQDAWSDKLHIAKLKVTIL